jgi:cytochrome c553
MRAVLAGAARVAGRCLAVCAVLAACSAAASADEANERRAARLAATCAPCHGTNGFTLPGSAIDELVNSSEQWMANRLLAFLEGRRPATIMHQVVRGYTREELALIARYLAAVPDGR